MRQTSYHESYWFNINDSDKLDFNQEMASIVINVIETSLHKQFPTWKDFNLKMKMTNFVS